MGTEIVKNILTPLLPDNIVGDVGKFIRNFYEEDNMKKLLGPILLGAGTKPEVSDKLIHFLSYELRIINGNIGDLKLITFINSIPKKKEIIDAFFSKIPLANKEAEELGATGLAAVLNTFRNLKQLFLVLVHVITYFIIFWILFGMECDRPKNFKGLFLGVVIMLIFDQALVGFVTKFFDMSVRDMVWAIDKLSWIGPFAALKPVSVPLKLVKDTWDECGLFPRNKWLEKDRLQNMNLYINIAAIVILIGLAIIVP